MKEVWKNAVGYEELYEVSNLGNIRNKRTKKLKKPFIHKSGWLRVQLYKNNKKRNCRVHRLVAEAFIPNPENKKEVNHINCIKDDNCVTNLEWVTGEENNTHYLKFVTNLSKV